MFSKDFYPTPAHIAADMLAGIDFNMISSVLEPSAGKGDLADAVRHRFQSSRRGCWCKENWDIDTIELNSELRHILSGKGYRVVHDDFLSYHTEKRYDLIVMNPPFADGKRPYQEMNQTEQAVVDAYEGQEAYSHMLEHKEYFIADTAPLMRLTSGMEA